MTTRRDFFARFAALVAAVPFIGKCAAQRGMFNVCEYSWKNYSGTVLFSPADLDVEDEGFTLDLTRWESSDGEHFHRAVTSAYADDFAKKPDAPIWQNYVA